MNETFRKFAAYISRVAGSHPVFLVVVMALILSGWYYDFSEKWEKHTSFVVSVATFLMIFFLQNSQNFSEKATHLKLDELIRAVEGARNEVASAEEKEEREIDALRQGTIAERKDVRTVQKQR